MPDVVSHERGANGMNRRHDKAPVKDNPPGLKLKRHDTFYQESFIFKYFACESCKQNYCLRRSIFLVELIMVIFILLLFGTFALLHFEAESEISDNKLYVELMKRIRLNISDSDFQSVLDYTGRDPIRGTENFVDYDMQKNTWNAGKSTSFGKVMFFTFTLISTIGYGDFSVTTPEGTFQKYPLNFSAFKLVLTVFFW